MNEGERPNPDALLAAIQSAAAREKRGSLKVFLGMCPGVGKTYAMLEAARRELAADVDVVIGYVETHGRKETDALTNGLPLVPRKAVDHRGITLAEIDLDAVLARHPRLRTPTRPVPAVLNAGRTSRNCWMQASTCSRR